MQVWNRMPRIRKGELEDLIRVRKVLDSLYDSLERTSLQSKPMLQAGLVDVAGALDRLIQRQMAAMKELLEGERPETPQEAPRELRTGETLHYPPKPRQEEEEG